MLVMNKSVVSVNVELLEYSPTGIERLRKVIQATLRLRRWSERDLTRAVQAHLQELNAALRAGGREELKLKASHGTINRYANGSVRHPQDDVMEAIAPFIFRVIAINGDRVELDTSRTYSDDWREFAYIGTSFYEEASQENTKGKRQHPGRGRNMFEGVGKGSGAVGRLIRAVMQAKGLDPVAHFREFSRFFPSVEEADIEHLRAIVAGEADYVTRDLLGAVGFALRAFTDDDRYTTDYVDELNNHFNNHHANCG